MYLFQPGKCFDFVTSNEIYIPLCIYFNVSPCKIVSRIAMIYIPLCIYFNLYVDMLKDIDSLFTFHYVSISTWQMKHLDKLHQNLHSTMYLFQRVPLSAFAFEMLYLHSTMYLFQRITCPNGCLCGIYLHSTMYLFQPDRWYNVQSVFRYLHSTMYLFQPRHIAITKRTAMRFTFHYVSISTVFAAGGKDHTN